MILVGAVGGSGTRVVARLLRHAGCAIGAQRNAFEDSQPLIDFYDRWLRRYLEAGRALPSAESSRLESDFEQAIRAHGAGAAEDAPVAVKVPKSLLMLRFWAERYPDLRFVHVVRSGLDMAYSSNDDQLVGFGDLVLDPNERRLPRPLRAMAYWRRVNWQTVAFCNERLGERSMVLRFEDLCRNAPQTATNLAHFVGRSIDAAAAASEVSPPASLERWRQHGPREVLALLDVGRPALEQFGYWSDELYAAASSAAREHFWRYPFNRGAWLPRVPVE